MKRSKRLQVIVDLKAKNEKKALETLGKVQTQKQTVEHQLESLQQYSQEYLSKYKALGESGVKIQQLLEFRSFMSKLDQAVIEQQQVISTLDEEISKARMHWKILYQKRQSLEKLVQSAFNEEQYIENKKEQFEQDDRASRIGRKMA